MTRRRLPRAALLWLTLLAGAVAWIVWQLQRPTMPIVDSDEEAVVHLVSSPYEQWSAIELLYRGERVRFERDETGRWLRHEAAASETSGHAHPVDAAVAERIGAVLTTFSRARIERRMAAQSDRMESYGLSNPALIMLIQDRDAKVVQTIELGEVAPDGLSRYVHVPQTRQVSTIADFQARGLLSLLEAPAPLPVRP